MARTFIGYGRQTISDADIAAVVDVLNGEYLTQGPAVERFEAALAERVGARHAVACSNGTAALHLACLAAGLGPGDTALVPTMTFVATANAPIYCGAETQLTDIDSYSRSMTAEDVSSFVRSVGAKAVLPVHFAGLAAAMVDVRAAANGLVVIEDACHALGGAYEDGQLVGSCAHSDMAAFSFHPVKPITSGEGGAVTTNDKDLAQRLRQLRNHGIERDPDRFVDVGDDEPGPWRYQQQMLGFNYRMTDMQAALGLAQLTRLDSFLARRREIAAQYDAVFGGLQNVAVPQADAADRSRSGLHLYQLDIDFAAAGTSRRDLMQTLATAGIGTQVHYIPVHRQPFHRVAALEHGRFPAAEKHYKETLSIPFFPAMTDEDVDFVASEIVRNLT